MSSGARRTCTLIAGSTIACLGCSPFAGLEPSDAGAELDRGSDAGVAQPSMRAGQDPLIGVPTGRASCALSTPPTRPRIGAELPDPIEFTVAVRTVDMGDSDQDSMPKYREIGFDLDGTCTGLGDGDSCKQPPWSTGDHTDGDGGRDNAVGAMLYRIWQTGGSSSTVAVNSSALAGVLTTAIRVRGYNGTSVDDQVEVAVYAATTAPDAEAAYVAPSWDGEDEWYASDHWVGAASSGDGGLAQSIEAPKYYDPNAYVTDYVLVAHFFELRISIGVLSQAVMSARIAPWEPGAGADGSEHFVLEQGTFAGRLSMDALLRNLSVLRDNLSALALCSDAPEYLSTKQRMCSYADIRSWGRDDGSLPCDAASWAWNFEAEPMKLVGIAHERAPQQRCSPETTPENDSCDTLTEPRAAGE